MCSSESFKSLKKKKKPQVQQSPNFYMTYTCLVILRSQFSQQKKNKKTKEPISESLIEIIKDVKIKGYVVK